MLQINASCCTYWLNPDPCVVNAANWEREVLEARRKDGVRIQKPVNTHNRLVECTPSSWKHCNPERKRKQQDNHASMQTQHWCKMHALAPAEKSQTEHTSTATRVISRLPWFRQVNRGSASAIGLVEKARWSIPVVRSPFCNVNAHVCKSLRRERKFEQRDILDIV